MQHKGLIYTLAILTCLAFFISLIGFGLKPSGATSFTIDTYPSGAKIFLDGKLLGKTPFILEKKFFENHDVNLENANIFKIFSPNINGLEIYAAKKPILLSFALPEKKGFVPERFNQISEKNSEFKTVKPRAFITNDFTNKIIVSFDAHRLAPIDPLTKSKSSLTLLIPANEDTPLNSIADYKSFKRLTIPAQKP